MPCVCVCIYVYIIFKNHSSSKELCFIRYSNVLKNIVSVLEVCLTNTHHLQLHCT